MLLQRAQQVMSNNQKELDIFLQRNLTIIPENLFG
jgi:hypothetical protein